VHCATGTIAYQDGSTGRLLYLKASLTGDEPYDVEQYKKGNPDFPHQSTANQFYTESQFESYRTLGRHVAEVAFEKVDQPVSHADLQRVFTSLSDRWLPPSAAAAGVFTKHASAYTALVQQLNADLNLRFLDGELLPGFPRTQPKPDADSEPMRKARLLLVGFLQLMEDVYIDLNLEEDAQFNHEQNRGWIVLFQMWAKPGTTLSDVMRDVGQTYGTAFQRFFAKLSRMP
jgi:hypothetical protein